jgi:hypothetical protein
MVHRAWHSSGFSARIGGTSPSQDSAVSGNHWRELYQAALREVDLDQLSKRLKAAEDAIHARVSRDVDVLDDERIAIQSAISALDILKAVSRRSGRAEEGPGS